MKQKNILVWQRIEEAASLLETLLGKTLRVSLPNIRTTYEGRLETWGKERFPYRLVNAAGGIVAFSNKTRIAEIEVLS